MLHIKRRIHIIHILLIQLFAKQLHCLAKALEMHKLALAQELDRLSNVGIVRKAQNVIVGFTRLLLCCNGKSATYQTEKKFRGQGAPQKSKAKA